MADLNTALSPSPVVECETASGNTGTSFTGNVTVALGNNPTGATLGGTKTVAAVAGFATFSTLTLDRSGKGFTLRATANNLKTTTSSAFDIATELTFTTQPAGGQANTTLPAVVVKSLDSAGNTDTNYTGDVTLTKWSGPGVLSGTLTKPAVSGVATFSDLKISLNGTYALMANGETVTTAYPPASRVSDDFDIGAYTLNINSNTSGPVIVMQLALAASIPVNNPIDLVVNILGDVRTLTFTNFGVGNSWNAASTFKLVNQAHIFGLPGTAGNGCGNSVLSYNGFNGTAGGLALNLGPILAISIDNGSGNIWGGGGGGGGGGGVQASGVWFASGGGGGGGVATGLGNTTGGTGNGSGWSVTQSGTSGSDASGLPVSGSTPGIGGVGYHITNSSAFASAGDGGNGGSWGAAGSVGSAATNNQGQTNGLGGLAGAAGEAIRSDFVCALTWLAGDNPTQVKGTVTV